MLDIQTKYNPETVEEKWYKFWISKNYFVAKIQTDKPNFSMVIPPPNITGSLHIGHAFNNTIQDILARFKRTNGFNVLWLPGTDHAGIATQNVVERELAKDGITRKSIGRASFIEKVWEWKDKYGDEIINQLKKLGASCDWTRLRFTMDDVLSNAVQETFIRLYKEGLIYRDNYIINWCPRCLTALSDIEVEHKDVKGHLYYIKYPFKDGKDFIVVATTRPETMLGDTAVAVNPLDEKYKQWINRTIILPLVKREIPLIADESVDMKFGTGAVKVTPSHDLNDFEIGKRHNLQRILIMKQDGTMTKEAGKYKNLDRYVCRQHVLKDLQELNFLVKVEEHLHAVGHCYRCNTVVEPYLSLQWFVRMKELSEPAIKVVKEGKVKLIPSTWNKTYFEWLSNIRDWCISRQIWWGHRLPVWYCSDCNEVIVEKVKQIKCPKCMGTKLNQDDDVLDTWFSSALWPFSTLGWPENKDELKIFYPTSVLSTGFDIIFFWVARMIMIGVKLIGDVPFREVYIHALIRDAEGAKMSKSKGNVIDPVEVINEYGADALRFTLASLAIQGRDICISKERISGYRNFANKIWNAGRFILINLEGFSLLNIKFDKLKLDLADRWILSRLNKTINSVTLNLENFKFSESATSIYDFFWKEFCDWYIEIAKPKIVSSDIDASTTTKYILYFCLDQTLKLLHPFMPFITEEIWQMLPHKEESITISNWPKFNKGEVNEEVEDNMELIMDVIRAIRNIRTEMKVDLKRKIDVLINVSDVKITKLLEDNSSYILDLAKTVNLKIAENLHKPELSATAVLEKIEIYVPLEGIIDLEKEKNRMIKNIEEIQSELEKLGKKLKNEEFLQKAPVEIIAQGKERHQELQDRKTRLKVILDGLNNGVRS